MTDQRIKSLNDLLEVGLNLNPDILAVLLKIKTNQDCVDSRHNPSIPTAFLLKAVILKYLENNQGSYPGMATEIPEQLYM